MNNVVSISGGAYDPSAPIPDFIRPNSIEDMTDEQYDAVLDGSRTRRLQAHYRFQETKKLKNAASNAKLLARQSRCSQSRSDFMGIPMPFTTQSNIPDTRQEQFRRQLQINKAKQ